MLNFKYQNPAKIIFGRGTHKEVGTLINPETARMLLVYGGGSIKQNGTLDDVLDSLDENGVRYIELGGVKPNPRLNLVRQGIELCREKRINFLLAVGGGSVIDTAKAIAMGFGVEDDVWSFFENPNKIIEKTLPVGTIVTMPASGSESSAHAVIYNDDIGLKRSVTSHNLIPKFAILNPELTFSMPIDQIAYGASDILSHALECYFTQIKNVDFTDRLLEAAMSTVLVNGPQAVKNPMDYNVRAELMWTATVVHNDLLDTGRVGDWACHEISHEIAVLYDAPHGAIMSVLLPAWMKYVYKSNVDKFMQMADRIFHVGWSYENKEALVLDMIKRLELWYFEMGLPTRLRELNIGDEHFAVMAQKCVQGREYVGNFKKLDRDDIIHILKIAL